MSHSLSIQRLRGIACIMVLVQHLCKVFPNHILCSVIPKFLHEGKFGCHIFFALFGYLLTDRLFIAIEESEDNLSIVRGLCYKNFIRTAPTALVCLLISSISLLISFRESSQGPFGYSDIAGYILVVLRHFYSMAFCFLNSGLDSSAYFGVVCYWWMCVYWQFMMFWSIFCTEVRNKEKIRIISLLMFLFSIIAKYTLSSFILEYRFYYHIVNCLEVLLIGALIRSYIGAKITFEGKNSKISSIIAWFFVLSIWIAPAIAKGKGADQIMKYLQYVIVTWSSGALVYMSVVNNNLFAHKFIGDILYAIGMNSYRIYLLVPAVFVMIKSFIYRFCNVMIFELNSAGEIMRYSDKSIKSIEPFSHYIWRRVCYDSFSYEVIENIALIILSIVILKYTAVFERNFASLFSRHEKN